MTTDPHDARKSDIETRMIHDAEWRYHHTERLGIICEDREPTVEQDAQARREANEYLDNHDL